MALSSTFDDLKNMLSPQPKIDTKAKMFVHALKDIYWAEHQILAMLEEMEPLARDAQVHEMLATHHSQTRMHIERLEQVFTLLGIEPTTETCQAMKGILAEGNHLVGNTSDELRDTAIVFAAQAVEHYEIGRYDTMILWAEQLLEPKVAELLELNLADENETLELLEDYQRNTAEEDDEDDSTTIIDFTEDETPATRSKSSTQGNPSPKRMAAQRKTTRTATGPSKSVKGGTPETTEQSSGSIRPSSKSANGRKATGGKARKKITPKK